MGAKIITFVMEGSEKSKYFVPALVIHPPKDGEQGGAGGQGGRAGG